MPLILEQEPDVKFREVAQLFIADFARPSFAEQESVTGSATSTITSTKTSIIPLSETESALIALVRQQPTMTLQDLASHLKLKKGGIRYHIDKLKDRGILRRVGAKSGYWEITQE